MLACPRGCQRVCWRPAQAEGPEPVVVVERIHQDGSAAAIRARASSAVSASAKIPKHVGPEPDILANRQPQCRNCVKAVSTDGHFSTAVRSRSFLWRWSQSTKSESWPDSGSGGNPEFSFCRSEANTEAVASLNPGLTSTRCSEGHPARGLTRSPTPRTRNTPLHRQTGMSAPILANRDRAGIARSSILVTSLRAAAASAEPPPNPAATGNSLSICTSA